MDIKALTQKVVDAQTKRATKAKSPRNLSLQETNFEKFRKLCLKNGIHPSQVIDQLIGEIVERKPAR